MNKIIIVAVVIAIIGLGGYFWLKNAVAPAPALENQTPPNATIPAPVIKETPPIEQNIVTYNDAGYSPSTLNIKAGKSVMFKNESSRSMWTASAVHPIHAAYSGTSLGEHCPDVSKIAFDACAGVQPGNSWSFTFKKTGDWKYHNHLNPSDRGAIVVE